jgi:hypothetical protein
MAQATFLLKRRKKVTAWPISGITDPCDAPGTAMDNGDLNL